MLVVLVLFRDVHSPRGHPSFPEVIVEASVLAPLAQYRPTM